MRPITPGRGLDRAGGGDRRSSGSHRRFTEWVNDPGGVKLDLLTGSKLGHLAPTWMGVAFATKTSYKLKHAGNHFLYEFGRVLRGFQVECELNNKLTPISSSPCIGCTLVIKCRSNASPTSHSGSLIFAVHTGPCIVNVWYSGIK